ncbi:GumC family protein [Hephaestia sp. GCM10023244]|uniref:GumC family protein n=1 Tax=unclassified Hephaestia TaxID=2631281 RepID=UPI0020773B10|nr:lipopolysaccharide biosynthesis protein [Hephaestia sp. MAHUQ-44]MCM8729771.1 lipopolysaccharide biosynthesis protein [Hephaestia sp. MAHUQ-44]
MTNDIVPATVVRPIEILAILYRRRLWLLIPMLVGLVAAIAAVVLYEPQYRSSATLLIDSQQVPTTLVASPLTNMADERIAKIRQQVTSREQLTKIVEANNLYPKLRNRRPFDEVLGVMRSAIGVDLVGATGPGRATPGQTIALTLSFAYTDPAIAQAVDEQLVELFIAEDQRLRTEQASGTASFLLRRGDELRDRLVELETKRREIEAHYFGALPDQIAITAQSGAALRAEISRIDSESQGILQQNGLLAARSQEAMAAPDPGAEAVRRAEEHLNQLRAVYSDEYPGVVAAQAALDRQRATAQRSPAPRPGAGIIHAEIAAGRGQVGMLAQRRAQLVSEVANMDRLAALAPQAAYELNNLERDSDNLQRQYRDIREKQLEAQIAANLQKEGKGERFSVVDAPSFPIGSGGLARVQTLVLGALGGLGFGLFLVVAREFLAGTVHGATGVRRYTGVAPLAVIPMLPSGTAPQRRLGLQRALPQWRGAIGHAGGSA